MITSLLSPNQIIMANEKENIISQPDYSINVIACNLSRENVMNVFGSFYSTVVGNQPKEISKINTKQTKYLRSVPQESITGGKINGNFYIYCSASTDHGFGCLRTVLVCTIQVHPSVRLLAD